MMQLRKNSLDCRILEWCAWSPYAQSKADWLNWATVSSDMPVKEEKPALLWVNPMQRRRFSFLSRMMLETAHQLAQHHKIDAWVFASRHGELHTTVQLLQDIAKEAPLSPMAFSLSVHNTGAGLFSIAEGMTAPMNAIAAGKDTLMMALTDAVARQAQLPDSKIAVIYAEEALPEPYTCFDTEIVTPTALGMVVAAEGIPMFTRRVEEITDEHSSAEALIRWLSSAHGEATALLSAEHGAWCISRSGD